MKTSPATRRFLVDLIPRLEDSGCNPILLRNYENFPDEIGNDLDVFVSGESLSTAYSTLTSTAEEQGGWIAHVHRRGYFVAVWLRFPDCTESTHIDLYHGALTWHGLPFLRDEELITHAKSTGSNPSYRIPMASHEALISCLASILWGGFFKARYQEQLSSLLAEPSQLQSFEALMEHPFGQTGRTLATAVAQGGVTSLVDSSFAHKMRMNLGFSSLRSDPPGSLKAWCTHWMEEAACYIQRLPGVSLEYDADQLSPAELRRLRENLDPYFGATHEIGHRPKSFADTLKIRRLRGKNHLVLWHGDQFSINGKPIRPLIQPSVDDLAAEVLSELSERISLQYNSK